MNTYKIYKVSRWLYLHHIPLFPKLLKGINYLIHSCSVPYQNEIGRRCRFLYGGLGTVIGKGVTIGEHVLIGPNVTIGGRSNKPGMPSIGNNVYIAAGSKILGDITIADNVIIGANAVVIHSVPSNCSVGGVPAHILRRDIDVNEFCSLNRL